MDAIRVIGLTRAFDDLVAVDSLSFNVKEGELFGFLGPNGAGKTTTINMLTTLLHPSGGEAYVQGYDITKEKDSVRRSIGVVFQEPAVDTKLTGRENLEFHAMLYGMGKEERRKRIDEVLRIVELVDKADILVENYSGGMKRRLEIGRGLIHKPKVLFLDEPTIGLDAQTRRNIWEHIKKLNHENNITIILTTHYMEEADYLCERIAIVDHGKLVSVDTPENLKKSLGGDIVYVGVQGDVSYFAEALSSVGWIKSAKVYGKNNEEKIMLTLERGDERIPQIISEIQGRGGKIKSIDIRKPSLEDVFLHFTGKKIRDENGRDETHRRMMKHRVMRHG